MSRNTDSVLGIYDAFNRRDWDKMRSYISDSFTENSGGHTYTGKDGAVTSARVWADAFEDAKVTDVRLHDAGETVVAEFVGRGTHTAQLDTIPATGKSVALPYCEIYRFNNQGEAVAMTAYFDQLALLGQLGVIDVPQQETITLETPATART